jgi:hypothetical protein
MRFWQSLSSSIHLHSQRKIDYATSSSSVGTLGLRRCLMPIKKHGRKAKSIFRYGLDYLRRTVLKLEQFADEFCMFSNFCRVLITLATFVNAYSEDNGISVGCVTLR